MAPFPSLTMKGSLFSPSRSSRHRLLKTFHNLRVTLLCSLLTFIVLRSSLGAGKFGTPAKDYDEIRHHLHHFRLRHQQRLLSRRELAAAQDTLRSTLSFDHTLSSSRSTLSLVPTLSSQELEGSSGDGVYQRRHFSPASMPRIMLVTSSASLVKCESTIEAQFLLKLLKNKMDYCHFHGIDIFLDAEIDIDGEAAKERLLRKLLVSHPEVEWIWWMDSTAMVTNMSYELPYKRLTGHNIVTHNFGGGDASHDVIGRSTLVRNCEWTMEYLANAEWQQRRAQPFESMVLHVEADDPVITDFRRCNVCCKDVDLSCFTHIDKAYHIADGQHSYVASL